MTRQELERRIREGISVSAQMGFRVLELTENAISVCGGGDENVNVHGTAFAGSLYAICTLSAWGLIHSRLPKNAALVMAKGSIRYLRPVIGDIIAQCTIPQQELEPEPEVHFEAPKPVAKVTRLSKTRRRFMPHPRSRVPRPGCSEPDT